MPSIRIGFSTDLNLVNEQVGIGTTNPTARLDVRGQIRADNSAGSGGITTLTRYDGFLNKTQSLPNNVSIAQTTKGNLNSLSGEIVVDGEITVEEGTALTGGRLDSLTVTGTFDIPHGGSEDREETPEKGSTRFNQDLGQLEFYTGYEWRTVGSYDGSGRGRGVFGGGYTAPGTIRGSLEYVILSTLGNSLNFGDLLVSRRNLNACASFIRGLFAGGAGPRDDIDYITIASEGNAIDFGNLSVSRFSPNALSSSTRGIWAGGGNPGALNVIDYVEISTIGNALDFGDLIATRNSGGAASSPTRGIIVAGNRNDAEFITIASKGNGTTFGELTSYFTFHYGCSSGIRAVFGGGNSPAAGGSNIIDYLTIATTGNAQDFGDLNYSTNAPQSFSSTIRGIWMGGDTPSGFINALDYITIASTGNAQDFGDAANNRVLHAACSDSHGGLGGF